MQENAYKVKDMLADKLRPLLERRFSGLTDVRTVSDWSSSSSDDMFEADSDQSMRSEIMDTDMRKFKLAINKSISKLIYPDGDDDDAPYDLVAAGIR